MALFLPSSSSMAFHKLCFLLTFTLLSGLPQAHGRHGNHRDWLRTHHHHKRAIGVTGWPLFPDGSLAGVGLDSACESSLYTNISCDAAASALLAPGYLGSFDNSTLTESVCSTSCETSIGNLADKIAEACADTPNLVDGVPFKGIIDTLWGNWNQSCFTDPDTGENCNGKIQTPKTTSATHVPRC